MEDFVKLYSHARVNAISIKKRHDAVRDCGRGKNFKLVRLTL